jgi:UDP-3-O-[3-hydroxymyristoyl] N-acetylglucosamine deacetylase / 3-hydroxyacyl-[acyl-carrier-protein] dehydratase
MSLGDQKGQGMLRATRPERTITSTTEVRGFGFFRGADVTLRFNPADAGTGVVFVRTDLPDQPTVPARTEMVIPSPRRTTIRRGAASVEMIEHVMAALAGMRIDNCIVQVDASECPGCDGSSQAFVEALNRAGAVEQDKMRQALVIERGVSVREGDAILAAHPGAPGTLTLSYHLDYGQGSPIAAQSFCIGLSPESYRDELAASRTFVLESEANALRALGIGTRATAADLLIFGREGLIGNVLRYTDECARHKTLDMVGDLALVGFDLHGFIVAHRSGHQTNHALARRLLRQAVKSTVPRSLDGTFQEHGTLDIQAIMNLLPHRYPFLLVDRVLELEPGHRALAIKNVSVNEPFFRGHWPGQAIMPGVLIVEALAQTAGVLIAKSVEWRPGWVALIASINSVKLRRPVVPGDQLRLEVFGQKIKSNSACVTGQAKVGDTLAAEAKLRFVMVDAERAARSFDGNAPLEKVPARVG